ncbi:hypothetical protein PG993_008841 [Apiospora rasikravindrae]|uniref:Heterokaryon incompatibility domain-containing protein n=1 Tax=Apiospora rasikravindrae TaxID=990691 RepID=A0ABR1SPH1_9PEZI
MCAYTEPEIVKLGPHRHRPLTSEGSIRVVDLLPGAKEDAIHCKLREVDLDDLNYAAGAQYEALSYAWGDSHVRNAIQCDGQPLAVTVNCWQALRQLRRDDCVRTLWIDAICIDQSCDTEESTRERNHQVKLMGRIYQNASRVLAWLGLEDAIDTPKLFEFFDIVQRLPQPIIDSLSDYSRFAVSNLYKLMSGSGALGSFERFITRPWFFRMWTLQEVALAYEVILVYGQWTVDWDTFRRGCVGHATLVGGMVDSFQVSIRHDVIRWIRQQSPLAFGIRQLGAVRNLECSLPHDKIYGMYAILASLGIPLESPDYSQPVTMIIERVTLSLIQHFQNLAVIMLTLPPSPTLGMASWVPDWLTPLDDSRFVDYSGTFFPGSYSSFSVYHASKDAKHDPTQRGTVDNSLIVSGKAIGRIAKSIAASSPWDKTKNNITDMELFTDMIRVCRQWCRYISQGDRPIHLSGDHSPIRATHLALLAVNNMKQHRSWTLETFGKWFALMTDPETSPVFLARLRSMREQKQILERLEEEEEDPVSLIRTLLNDSHGQSEDAIQIHANAGVNYAFVHLDSGYIGRAHHSCQEGDSVYLFAGADMPVVVRRCGEGGTFRVVAPAFIVGVMDGELWPGESDEELELITLV